MNICFVSVVEPSPTMGGVENVCSNLISALRDMGHSVVSCFSYKSPDKACEGPGFLFPDVNNPESAANLDLLKGVLSEYKIDIIFNHSYFIGIHNLCVEARRGTGVKLVYAYHTSPRAQLKDKADQYALLLGCPRSWRNFKELAYRTLIYPVSYYRQYRYISRRFRTIYDQSDAFVVLSPGYKKDLARIAGLKEQSKLFAIPNPVAMLEGTPVASRKKQILFVGRMEWPAKRPDRLLKIWKRLYRDYPDWTLLMLGDGPHRDLLEDMTTGLGLDNVRFTGRVDPLPYFRESRMLCMTSTYEGFGLVLVEAQANGCVPVAFDSFGAAKDIITDGENGYLVKPFSKRRYAARLRLLMEDEKFCAGMGARGKDSVKKLDVGKISQEWVSLFSKLLDGKA